MEGVPEIYKADSEYRYESQPKDMKVEKTVNLDTLWGEKDLKMYVNETGNTTTTMFYWNNLKCEFVIEDTLGDFIFTVTSTDVITDKKSATIDDTANMKLDVSGTTTSSGYDFDIVGNVNFNAHRTAACAYFNHGTSKISVVYEGEEISTKETDERALTWSKHVDDGSDPSWGIKSGTESIDSKLFGKIICDKYYKFEAGNTRTTYVIPEVKTGIMIIEHNVDDESVIDTTYEITEVIYNNHNIKTIEDLKKYLDL